MNRLAAHRLRLAADDRKATAARVSLLRRNNRPVSRAGRRRVAQIFAYARQLAHEFHPWKIILFGSYAYGRPTQDSDVDLLVIMPHRSGPIRQSIAIRQRCAAPFPLDLLVWTPAYARKRQSWNDSFTREIFAKGKTLYEAGHA